MSTNTRSKINRLLTSQPSGVVFQSRWLTTQGYTPDLQKKYRRSGWLDSIGVGAMIRTGDQVGYEGAIYALQKQTNSTVHPGGRTALILLGKAHYLEMSAKSVVVFGGKGESLPEWFREHDWGLAVDFYCTSFLPSDLGLTELEFKTFSIGVSGAVRAMMECLYLTPRKQDLVECYQFMEGLNNLRPDQVQMMLEKCSSIKVKRLFLYMAKKSGHAWFDHLDLRNVDLGRGKRLIARNGVYIDEFRITVPRELEAHGSSDL